MSHGSPPGTHRIRVVAGVTWRGDRVLITQRPPRGRFGLQWEFPGGKIEPGESAERALERELHEELGVTAKAVRVLATYRHSYAHGLDVELVMIECTLESHVFGTSEAVHALRWVRPEDIGPDDLLEADRPFLAELASGAFRPPERSR
jgi:8-oxo-dGTP diphosphatase